MPYTPETYQIEEILAIHDALDKAAEKGYLLSTSQVKTILGFRPRKTGFTYGSFYISPWQSTRKIGRENCWEVRRSIDP